MIKILPRNVIGVSQKFVPDVFASIAVFLIALPLCMGIAIACGVSPAVGLISGIIGGILVGSLGGCPLQVTGPAAGLVVVVSELLRNHGAEQLGVMVLIAGVFQLLAGFFNAAQWFRAVTPAVVNGMLSGIGVLIFASQFHVMVDDVPKHNGLLNLISIPSAIYKGIIPDISKSHDEAALIGITTIASLVLWNRFAPKCLRLLPGALIAVVVAMAVAWAFKLPVHYLNLPGNIWQCIHSPSVSGLVATMSDRGVLLGGLSIALIASAETLLTATAVDKMHTGARTDYNRELAAQGLGNIICGWLGVLPLTGVMARSGFNVGAGAKSRMSTVLHGLWLLTFVTFFPFCLKFIPVSSLAALLVVTGYKLVNIRIVKELSNYGRTEVAIYIVTVASIVAVDLLTGVVVGMTLAAIKLLNVFARLEVTTSEEPEHNRVTVWLNGAATFVSLPKLASTLDNIRAGTQLHLRLGELLYIDHACLDLLMNWQRQHRSNGGTIHGDELNGVKRIV